MRSSEPSSAVRDLLRGLWCGYGERLLESLGGGPCAFVHDSGVYGQSHSRVGMAEAVLDGLDVDAGHDQLGGVGST